MWPDLGVSLELKKQSIYPVRPEQLSLSEGGRGGIKGRITSVQYQGKEIHYTVEADGQDWFVHTGVLEREGWFGVEGLCWERGSRSCLFLITLKLQGCYKIQSK